ncbi:MAG: hypothetical protein LUH03_09885 [Oscillospiraceae bacterium]|nr:hypothetical protein [Oscillospiraceae bacterium]
MFSSIKAKFKENPQSYYAFSIAASWAGVGSLMNSVTLTQQYGLVPSMIWGFCNSLACVLFGLVACHLPTLRSLMRTKVMQYIIGIMSVFQLWINMNGIREIFEDTVIGTTGGTVIVYAVCIIFIVLLLRFGMIRNVLTDTGSWLTVYGLVFLLTIVSMLYTGGVNKASLGLEWDNLSVGIQKGLLLLPGPFTYPYFYKLLDYNDQNEDSTHKTDIRKSFALGGMMFGFYMLFTYVLAMVEFSPALNLLKAILVSIVGISTISTFIYSEYIVFGKKLGLAIDAAAVIFWPLLITLGVMGVWTLMAEIRIYLIIALLIIALVKRAVSARKGVRS